MLQYYTRSLWLTASLALFSKPAWVQMLFPTKVMVTVLSTDRTWRKGGLLLSTQLIWCWSGSDLQLHMYSNLIFALMHSSPAAFQASGWREEGQEPCIQHTSTFSRSRSIKLYLKLHFKTSSLRSVPAAGRRYLTKATCEATHSISKASLG